MNERILNEYLLNDLDNRIETYENAIDVYSSGTTVGLNNIYISGNVVFVSGGVAVQSINALNADFSCKTFTLLREISNVVPFTISQYSSGTVVMGLNFVRGGGQLSSTGSHLDVTAGMSIGTILCRAVVTGATSPTFSTGRFGCYATQPHTQTARGTAFQVFLTPSGSATGGRRVFNIDSNGDTTLGTNTRVPLFDLWTKSINTSGDILPMVDNTYDLGSTLLRFNDVYAVNGIITVSDPSYKNSLRTLSFSSSDFINSINVYEGKFNNSRSNRFHIFFNSHEIKEYFKKHNLDYGITVEDNGIVALRYQEIIPILLQNVKELNCQVKELNNKVTILEEMNKAFYIKIYEWIRGFF